MIFISVYPLPRVQRSCNSSRRRIWFHSSRRYDTTAYLRGLFCILSSDRHIRRPINIDRQMSNADSRSRKKSGKKLGFSTVRDKRQARLASPWNIIAKTSWINPVLLARAKRGSSITGQLDNGRSTVDFYPSLVNSRFYLKYALAAIFIWHYALSVQIFFHSGRRRATFSCLFFFFFFFFNLSSRALETEVVSENNSSLVISISCISAVSGALSRL